MLLEQIIVGVGAGAMYALLAVAVVLIYTGTRTLSICMGEIGAFAFFTSSRWRENGMPIIDWKPSALAAGLIAIVIGAVIALALERVVMRSLVPRPPLDGLIATLGIALALALLELKIFGINGQPVRSPVGDRVVSIAGADLVAPRVAALLLAVVVAVGLYLFLTRTKFGLATRAAVSDATVARLLGVRVNQVYMFAWGAGGALSALAVALIAPAFGNSIFPFDQTNFELRALAGAVIGGLDSLWGAIVGSLLVGIVEQVVQGYWGSGEAAGAVLLLVLGTLLVRPRGLLGATGAA